jgi:hypothetical protein
MHPRGVLPAVPFVCCGISRCFLSDRRFFHCLHCRGLDRLDVFLPYFLLNSLLNLFFDLGLFCVTSCSVIA